LIFVLVNDVSIQTTLHQMIREIMNWKKHWREQS